MPILTLDTSSKACTIALGTKDKLLVEYCLNLDYTHSDYLLLLIEQALKVSGLKVSDIEAIGVVSGPGSFTGLRIGMAVAKGLAISANCSIYSYTSLEVLASAYWGSIEPVIVTIPAQRNQVYTGQFDCSNGRPLLMSDYFIGKLNEEVKSIIEQYQVVRLVNNNNTADISELDLCCTDIIKSTPFHNYSRASMVLPLVTNDIINGEKPSDIESIEPFYMRISAAEEQRLKREGKNA